MQLSKTVSALLIVSDVLAGGVWRQLLVMFVSHHEKLVAVFPR